MRWKKHNSYRYIGVTGFMNNSEVKKAIEIVPENTTYNLMVGILMSSKTLAGFANKYPSRYPQRENIADIFIDHPKALNLVHYSTDTPEKLLFELYCLTDLGGKNLDGFQLNIAWPSIVQLEDYFFDHPETFIVLQIGKRAMAEVDNSPKKLADMIENYLGIIDAILIDESGGKGESLNIIKIREYLKVIHDRQYPIGLGVAGGLGPKTVHIVKPLFEEFDEFNIDAENALRTPKPEDALDCAAMKEYLTKAYNMH